MTAPQLFPTPPALAARMVGLAGIEEMQRVLEPSAGTGNILRFIGNAPDKVAVEINGQLVRSLLTLGLSGLHVHHGDFLECNHELGTFDRILMNPPFANGQDIKHITHAFRYLSPGGRLVAICANGPRQNDKLRPIVDARGGIWEELPRIRLSVQEQASAPYCSQWTHSNYPAHYRVSRRAAAPVDGPKGTNRFGFSP